MVNAKAATVPAGDGELIGDRLLMTADALYLMPGKKAVPYGSVSHITAAKDRDDLDIFHRRTFLPWDNCVMTVRFKGRSTRDLALEALERHPDPRFRREEITASRLRASLRPLLWACLAALFTLVSVPAAALIADGEERYFYMPGTSARPRIFIPLFRLLGPKGVAVLGGLLVLGCLVWLVLSAAQPPDRIVLSKR